MRAGRDIRKTANLKIAGPPSAMNSAGPWSGAGAAKLYYGTSEVQVPKLVQVAELTAAQFVFGQRVAAQAEI